MNLRVRNVTGASAMVAVKLAVSYQRIVLSHKWSLPVVIMMVEGRELSQNRYVESAAPKTCGRQP